MSSPYLLPPDLLLVSLLWTDKKTLRVVSLFRWPHSASLSRGMMPLAWWADSDSLKYRWAKPQLEEHTAYLPMPGHRQMGILAQMSEGTCGVGWRHQVARSHSPSLSSQRVEVRPEQSEAPSLPSFPEGAVCGFAAVSSSFGMKLIPSRAIPSYMHKHLETGQTLARVWNGPAWKGLALVKQLYGPTVWDRPSPLDRYKKWAQPYRQVFGRDTSGTVSQIECMYLEWAQWLAPVEGPCPLYPCQSESSLHFSSSFALELKFQGWGHTWSHKTVFGRRWMFCTIYIWM